jgi:CRISPR-associated protein Csd1
VWGAQTAGASIVSFNLDAFTSYGHEQGDNAPVSEAAAFAYTTALNRFLERDSKHRLQIGDASTVFWADAKDAEAAKDAESLFVQFFNPQKEEADATKNVGILLARLKKGEPLEKLDPELPKGVHFYVLGLAPNAARISIRFYYDDDFRELVRNCREYFMDMQFEPRPKDRRITINSLVLRTAPARKDRNNQIKFDGDQVSPLLAGELFRAILTGDRFPRALLAQILMRVRSDHLLDSLRISMIKAVIARDMRKEDRLPKEDYLVRSDPDDPNPARRLGKLFALIQRAQLAALGDKINTTVKDKYLGTCAATPAQVMSKLILNAEQHHLKRLRNGHSDAEWIKDADHARRVGAGINRDLGRLAASYEGNFPAQQSDEDQGFFLIGYYQERFGSTKAGDDGGDPHDDDQTNEGEE